MKYAIYYQFIIEKERGIHVFLRRNKTASEQNVNCHMDTPLEVDEGRAWEGHVKHELDDSVVDAEAQPSLDARAVAASAPASGPADDASDGGFVLGDPKKCYLLLPKSATAKQHLELASNTLIPLCHMVNTTAFSQRTLRTQGLHSLTREFCDKCFARLSDSSKEQVLRAARSMAQAHSVG